MISPLSNSELTSARIIVMLGLIDEPTCGVQDYCMFLGEALERFGVGLATARVRWPEHGWIRPLLQLWRESVAWRRRWVILQYTAGSWSRYGVPLGALVVTAVLRQRGVQCAVMSHEPYPWEQAASGLIRRIRSAGQAWVIRRLYQGSAKAIFADPLDTIPWLPANHEKAVFIPIGANVPESTPALRPKKPMPDSAKTVAVFCLSHVPKRQHELEDISLAVCYAASQVGRLRVLFIGRGTDEAKEEIAHVFEGSSVSAMNLGIQSAEEVSRWLSESDVMLCVRGPLFSRRGSAFVGIACGVPIIAYAGPAEQAPLAEAGIEFVPWRDRRALGLALVRILKDERLQAEMRTRSRSAQDKYFSWDRIARRHIEALGFDLPTPERVAAVQSAFRNPHTTVTVRAAQKNQC